MRHLLRQGRCSLLAVAAFLMIGLSVAPESRAQSGICAEVRLEIRQRVSLERQAFEAVLKINNGLEGISVEDVGVNVVFTTPEGLPVIASSDPNNTSARFFLRRDALTGIGAIDGTGVVAPKTVGEIRWLIIPAPGAGGNSPVGAQYRVGARITYRLGTEAREANVEPQTITVRPQPQLRLDYFLANEVYSDDPFTPEVEPKEPFTLGVRVRNSGFGSAKSLSIESAQPKIVENRQGLAVGFQIDGSYVQDQPASPTLLTNFGDIEPGTSKVGRWQMSTTLSGRFVEFSAGFSHADELGGQLTSLINSVESHLLVKDVRLDLPGRDSVRDFLARDGDVLRLYESNGVDTAVEDLGSAATLTAVPGQAGRYRVEVGSSPGPWHARISHPVAEGQTVEGVTLADGSALPVENAWISRTRDNNDRWQYFLNLFDSSNRGPYRVSYLSSAGVASLAGDLYVDADGNGQRDPGEAGLVGIEIALLRTSVAGETARTVQTAADGAYRFAAVPPGTYRLSVAAAPGFTDGVSIAGTAGGAIASGRIDGIVLAAGQAAESYRFAKRPEVVARSADVSLTLQSQRTQVTVGDQVTVNAGLANAGPDAASGLQVAVAVPAGWRLESGQASVGSFDVAQRRWSISELPANGSALLDLSLVPEAAGDVTLTGTASSSTPDPQSANNTRSLALSAKERAQLTPSLNVVRRPRVLLYAPCSRPLDEAVCRTENAAAFGALEAAGVAHRAVYTRTAFVSALYSGRWNIAWLNGTAPSIDRSLANELRSMVFAGRGLIVDNRLDKTDALLRTILPARGGRVLPAESRQIRFLGPVNGQTLPDIAMSGDALSLTAANGGTVLANFVPRGASTPALVTLKLGNGAVAVSGFRLGDLAQASAAGQAVFAEVLRQATPAAPARPVAGSWVQLAASVSNKDGARFTRVTLLSPAQSRLAEPSPAPRLSAADLVSWDQSIAANGRFDAAVLAKLPDAAGSNTFTLSAAELVEGQEGSATQSELALAAFGYRELIAQARVKATEVRAGLAAELHPNLDALLTALNEADADPVIGNRLTLRTALLRALDQLNALTPSSVDPIRVDVGQAFDVLLRSLEGTLPACGTAPQNFGGFGFSEFGRNESIEARGGGAGSGTWEWVIGANTNRDSQSARSNFNWVSSREYRWSAEIRPDGRAILRVFDGSALVAQAQYSATGAPNPAMQVGDALQIYVRSAEGLGTAKIDTRLTRVNGIALSGAGVVASTPGNGLPSETTLHLYARPADGLQTMEGVIALTYPGTRVPAGNRLLMEIRPGVALCRD